jgi:rare lipoprotein A
MREKSLLKPFLISLLFILAGCTLIKAPYTITKGAVKGTIGIVKTTYKVTAGTTKVVYKIGKFTYEVVKAPLDWPLTHENIDTIDGLPVKEAIRLGRVKHSPYTVDIIPCLLRKLKSMRRSVLLRGTVMRQEAKKADR